MIHSHVIIVGGGPAGSTCAWKLRQQGVECLILDKQTFPRLKLCAGWVTPDVLDNLQITAAEYPHTLVRMSRIRAHLGRQTFMIKAHQYAIRRIEFDNWLLQRSDAPVHTHKVKQIRRAGTRYVLDEQYSCDFLVGAGGTLCPVYREVFKPRYPRAKMRQVVTLEQEFPYTVQDSDCHLWFFQHRLPGYAWYVPKGDGCVNVGLGGFVEKLKNRQATISQHWQWFARELEDRSLIKNYSLNPGGYTYYVRGRHDIVQQDRAFLAGDAAGLATRDLAEGIGPAVKSGISTAEAIIRGKALSVNGIHKYSLFTFRK